MDENKLKIIEKLQKLLALSQSPNEHEAALAASKAQEMMDEYNLSIIDIKNPSTACGMATSDTVLTGYMFEKWEYSLHAELARVFDVMPIINRRFNNFVGRDGRIGKKLTNSNLNVIGLRTDIEVYEYTFTYLRAAISVMLRKEKDRMEEINKDDKDYIRDYTKKMNKYMFSYSIGVVTTIIKRVKSEREEYLDTHSNSRALVVIKRDAIEDFIKDMDIKGPKKDDSEFDEGAFHRGMRDGRQIQLHDGVAQEHQSLLGTM